MIISLVLGGLGNQLFQYAIARKISNDLQVPLKVETLGFHFKKYKIHPYCLDQFNIKAKKTTLSDYLKLIPSSIKKNPVVKEKSAAFDNSILNTKNNSLLIGYWHSEKYFLDIAHLLREEITLKNAPSDLTKSILVKIQNENAISIHVRRSDYISNAQNSKIFEVCSLAYYQEAIKKIAEKVDSPHFFVFSDDPKWTKENLKIDFPATYVTHNDVHHGHEDLMLMSSCKHNIIANSTFSWWGAWLNKHENKIVIAPKKWVKEAKYEEPDLLPESWIKI